MSQRLHQRPLKINTMLSYNTPMHFHCRDTIVSGPQSYYKCAWSFSVLQGLKTVINLLKSDWHILSYIPKMPGNVLMLGWPKVIIYCHQSSSLKAKIPWRKAVITSRFVMKVHYRSVRMCMQSQIYSYESVLMLVWMVSSSHQIWLLNHCRNPL